MTSALKVSGGQRRSHSRRRGLLGDMKYMLSGSRSRRHSRRMRGGVKGGAAPAAVAQPVVGGAVAAAAAPASVPEIAGGAVVAESKAPEVAPVSGGRRRSRSRRHRHRRYSRMRGGLFNDFQAPMIGGSRVFDAGFDGVLGGEIDGGRHRHRRHSRYSRR